MRLDPEKHRIVRFLAQRYAARRADVSEATLVASLGMERETLRQHVDALLGKYLTVERKLEETGNRWLRLSRAGEDYAREHGIL